MFHFTRHAINLSTLCVLLAVTSMAFAENMELRKRLVQIDSLRNGEKTPFDDIEKQCAELLEKYPEPEDQASIHFELAHMYAQSDIRLHPDRVTRYAKLALANEQDADRRATLFCYLGSAAEVDDSRKTFAEKRRAAAEPYLKGYKEVLAIGLPDEAPELPAVNIYESARFDPVLAAKHQAEMVARWKAEFARKMVQHRDILRRQVVELYKREPANKEELRQIAKTILEEDAAVDGLMGQVEKK